MTTIDDVLSQALPLQKTFPELLKLLKISLTIIVTTAECEKSFSCLKCIKSSTMSEQQLIDLAVLSIENKLPQELALDEVIEKFAEKTRKEE